MTDKEHIKLVSVGNRFWAKFSRIVAEALAELPAGREDEFIPYLQDKTSIYGSTYSEELAKLRKKGGTNAKEHAATVWTNQPDDPGLYVVQFIETLFPKGDPNNVCHRLVNMLGDGRILAEGRFLEASEMRGWKWARINWHK